MYYNILVLSGLCCSYWSS